MNSKSSKASFNSFSRQTPLVSRIIRVKLYTLLYFSVALLEIGGPLILIFIVVVLSLIYMLSF